mgnify:CR=1 FL=1
MDLLVSAYPLYLTHQYYSTQATEHLPLLSVWWSSFGVISLAEKYASIDNIPFYWITKTGVLLALYSSEYREWLQKHVLTTASSLGYKIATSTSKIIDEHFPIVKEYIKLKLPNDTSDKTSVSQGWFSGTHK